MKRRFITEPQYRLLKRLDESERGETRLGSYRDRAVARRLEAIDCAEPVGREEGWWRITNHGCNIRDLHRSFYEQEGLGA